MPDPDPRCPVACLSYLHFTFFLIPIRSGHRQRPHFPLHQSTKGMISLAPPGVQTLWREETSTAHEQAQDLNIDYRPQDEQSTSFPLGAASEGNRCYQWKSSIIAMGCSDCTTVGTGLVLHFIGEVGNILLPKVSPTKRSRGVLTSGFGGGYEMD